MGKHRAEPTRLRWDAGYFGQLTALPASRRKIIPLSGA